MTEYCKLNPKKTVPQVAFQGFTGICFSNKVLFLCIGVYEAQGLVDF